MRAGKTGTPWVGALEPRAELGARVDDRGTAEREAVVNSAGARARTPRYTCLAIWGVGPKDPGNSGLSSPQIRWSHLPVRLLVTTPGNGFMGDIRAPVGDCPKPCPRTLNRS